MPLVRADRATTLGNVYRSQSALASTPADEAERRRLAQHLLPAHRRRAARLATAPYQSAYRRRTPLPET